MKKIALLMISFAMVACGESASETAHEAEGHAEEAAHETAEAAEETAEAAEEGAEEAAEEVAEGAEEAAGGGSPCERAQACCEALVDIMPEASREQARQGCAAIEQAAAAGAAAEASCNQMIQGYQQSFQAMNHEVPSSCATN